MILRFVLFLFATALFGCDSKAPLDSDIEGFWRLECFETAADGQRHGCERLYFGITRYVVEVSERQGTHGYGTFVARFKYEDGGGKVAMLNFKHRGNTGDDGTDVTAEELLPFGMNASSTVFDVVSADGKRLVLKSDYAILYLSKF